MSPARLKIAIVCPYALEVPGGVQTHVVRLASALVAGGDEVLVVAPGARDCAGGAGREAMEVVDVGAYLKVRFNGAVAPIAVGPSAAKRTRAVLTAWSPDVVHVHEPAVPVVGWSAARFRQAPVVATLHAASESGRIYRLVGPLLGRQVVDRVTRVLAVSEAARDYHVGALRRDPSTVAIVPNGVDIDRFRRRAAHRFSDPRSRQPDPSPVEPSSGTRRDTLLFVGRLDRRKGLAIAVEAFRQLRRERDVRLIVVGDGPDYPVIRKGLSDDDFAAVDIRGRVSNDDLASAYHEADVYVAPSLGGESFGMVLLEAMAARTPVVAADIRGYRAVVGDGAYGHLVAVGDAAALAAGVKRVLEHREATGQIVAKAFRYAQRFDWRVIAATTREHYVDSLAG